MTNLPQAWDERKRAIAEYERANARLFALRQQLRQAMCSQEVAGAAPTEQP